MPNPGYINPKQRVIVNTVDDPANVSVVNQVQSPSPPPNDFLITTMTITSTATKIPATPSANRVGVEIFCLGPNYGGTGFSIFWGPAATVSPTLADGTTTGSELKSNESSNFQLSGGKDVYAVTKVGETARVQVKEWIRTP